MAARIQSLRNGIDPVDELSRNDLVSGDVVVVSSLDGASSYNWTLVFVPEGSAATFSGSDTSVSPGSFTVDVEGPYLVRLVIDVSLPTESTQYVRLRALTAFGQLHLVSAGERRDGSGVIPVDVDAEGWANEQNENFVSLKDFIKPLVSSGRLLYVDANDGTSNYADYSTVQAAITAATTAGASEAEQWIIAVRPGRYVEATAYAPWVHVIGWPGNPDGRSSEAVVIEGIQSALISVGTQTLLANLQLENNADSASATLTKTGPGSLRLKNVRVESNGALAGQGAALYLQGGSTEAIGSFFQHTSSGAADRIAFEQTGANSASRFEDCVFEGPSGISSNPTPFVVGVTSTFVRCRVVSLDAGGFGIYSVAELCDFQHGSVETASGSGITVNPTAGAFLGPVSLSVCFSSVQGDITFDATGLGGTTTLSLGSVKYGTLALPGGAVTTQAALTKAKTHFYDNTVTGLAAENVQDAIDLISGTSTISYLTYNKNFPEVPNDSVSYRGWSPVSSELIAIRVRMMTVNTQGNYTLTVVNEGTGNTVLGVTPFDMNSLASGIISAVALTAVPADLAFASLDGWNITLTSDDPNFDGSDVYVELVFDPSGGGGAITEDWATTLLIGNVSGGTNPTITPGDVMVYGDSPVAPLSAAGEGRLRYNQGSTAFQASVDGGAWADLGSGGGGSAPDDDAQFEMTVFPANTISTMWFSPYNCEVVGVKVYGHTSPATAGVYTLAVEDADNSNNLLAAATFDMTGLVATTLTSMALTGTAADLLLAAGTRVRFQLVSDNGDLAASGVYVQIVYRSQ